MTLVALRSFHAVPWPRNIVACRIKNTSLRLSVAFLRLLLLVVKFLCTCYPPPANDGGVRVTPGVYLFKSIYLFSVCYFVCLLTGLSKKLEADLADIICWKS